MGLVAEIGGIVFAIGGFWASIFVTGWIAWRVSGSEYIAAGIVMLLMIAVGVYVA